MNKIKTIAFSISMVLFLGNIQTVSACSTYSPTAVISGYSTTITFSGTSSYDNDPSTSSG